MELDTGKIIKNRTGLHIPMFSFDKASSDQTFSTELFKIASLEEQFDSFSFKRSIIHN
jgi:hypothetical protein